jgi:hypothetical protein
MLAAPSADNDATVTATETGPVPLLWGVDEDDGELFSIADYTRIQEGAAAAGFISYGPLKYDPGGNGKLRDIGPEIEAMDLVPDGTAYLSRTSKLKLNGSEVAAPVVFKFNVNDATTTGPNVVDVVGRIPIRYRRGDALSGLAVHPQTGQLYALHRAGGSGQPDRLLIISPENASVIANLGGIRNAAMGLACGQCEDLNFDPSGRLYVSDDHDDDLYELNPTTGRIVAVVNSNERRGLTGLSDSLKVESLAAEGPQGGLIAFDDHSDQFVLLSLQNGNNQTLGKVSGLTDVEGIDFAAGVAGILLAEGSNFKVVHEQTFTVPNEPSVLRFAYSNLHFDTSDDFVKDAFEAALLDAAGNPLVHTIAGSRDAFFNITEGESVAIGVQTVVNGQTVSIDLAHVPAGTETRLVLRLVNNDADTTTSVQIPSVEIKPGPLGTPIGAAPLVAATRATALIDLSTLSDVTASALPKYGQTTFNETGEVLFVDLALHNTASFVMDAPLVVAIDHISDPRVRVRSADGQTPDGLPYFDYSKTVSDDTLDPDEVTGERTVAFFNPEQIQFTYDLVVLAQLNRAPGFTTEPDDEALVGRAYVYESDATDPDDDSMSFSLSMGPAGASIDPDTGRITWMPAAGDLGSHAVTVRVEDGRGGSDEQHYLVAVVDGVPNRPPLISSTPVVDAFVNRDYIYALESSDPDSDPLAYLSTAPPAGMQIDLTTGVLAWRPTAQQLGQHNVTARVEDGRGGVATQSYVVNVQADPANHAPVIISQPPGLQTGTTSPPVTKSVLASALGPLQSVDLAPWDVVRYGLQDARWELSADNTVATQMVNADPSILLSDFTLRNERVEGSWQTRDTSDDDFMGFVFGYQDAGHFYLFDWKRADQTFLGFAERGMSIKLISADRPLTGADLWPTRCTSECVRLLYHNTIPWEHNTAYRFELDYRPGEFTITVRQGATVLATIALADDTYEEGRFGFYNYSQAVVRYEGFARQEVLQGMYTYDAEALDADADPLTFSLVQSPQGMTVDAATGQISWQASSADVGRHDVTVRVADGRGGFDEQPYVLEVAEKPVADLAVTSVDQSGLTFDGQLLTVAGTITATVANQGPGDLTDPFDVRFFEDRNGNTTFEAGTDNALGSTRFAGVLVAGASTLVTAALSDFVLFAGNVVYAQVDSGNAIVESDESNNYGRAVCEFVPPVGQFNPVVKFHALEGVSVMSTPMVVNLTDDNGDGRIDTRDIPDIVFATLPGELTRGYIAAVSGDDGHELFTAGRPNLIAPGSAVGVADIDGDGLPEIVAAHSDGNHLIAFEHDGTFKWLSDPDPFPGGAPWGGVIAIAHLDCTPAPEIIVGASVYSADGRLLGDGRDLGGTIAFNGNFGAAISAVADVDLDRIPEIIAGPTAYRAGWRAPDLPAGERASRDDYRQPGPSHVGDRRCRHRDPTDRGDRHRRPRAVRDAGVRRGRAGRHRGAARPAHAEQRQHAGRTGSDRGGYCQRQPRRHRDPIDCGW